jgi:hypothetical protein
VKRFDQMSRMLSFAKTNGGFTEQADNVDAV